MLDAAARGAGQPSTSAAAAPERKRRRSDDEGGGGGGDGDRRRRDRSPGDRGRDGHHHHHHRDGGGRHEPAPQQPQRPRLAADDPRALDALRQALTVGFGNRIARRLRAHNGYKTLAESGTLAQVHPGCAPMAVDGNGLLPEWVVYHELVATSKPFLRQVCATRYEWVAPLLPKLRGVDVARLSGGRRPAAAGADGGGGEADAAAAAAAAAAVAKPAAKRNDDATVNAARERYLARKKAGK